MKCKQCGSELPKVSKTMKIPELNIEVEIEVTQKNTTYRDLKWRKGWRLLNINEVVWLANSKYAKKLKMVS